jgi:23S rRNA (cytidine1920-2'-O)/16S rRNA (cytidine1409-2'-O)-methyltransferase
MARMRLDQLLVARALAESRSKAQALVMAGAVRVNGEVARRAAMPVAEDSDVQVAAPLPYVSRGGFKLTAALEGFRLEPAGLTALDVGAATGGFTDVLLQRGARRVFAVDVGYGVLDWRLRQDVRVIVMERCNIRHLAALPTEGEPILADCASIDVAFISLNLVLPAVQRLVTPAAWIVALIKPQFEAGPADVGKGGVVRDPQAHRRVLRDVLTRAAELGLPAHGLLRSPLTGPAGNQEFLAWLQAGEPTIDVEAAIAALLTGQ